MVAIITSLATTVIRFFRTTLVVAAAALPMRLVLISRMEWTDKLRGSQYGHGHIDRRVYTGCVFITPQLTRAIYIYGVETEMYGSTQK